MPRYTVVIQNCLDFTVGLEFPRLAAAVPRLVDGLDDEDVLGAALEPVHGVVVLLDVGHNHPAVGRVAQTWRDAGEKKEEKNQRRDTNALCGPRASFSIPQQGQKTTWANRALRSQP